MGILLVLGGIFIYFLPTIAAMQRGHRRPFIMFVLNTLFGWTIIGWFALLVMVQKDTTDPW